MFPALFRLLLCLCLLVDVVAPAVAATHVAIAAIGGGPTTPAATGEADRHGAMTDCHTLRDAAAPAPAAPTQDDDCLQRCLDLCLQHGVATMPAMTPLPPAGPAGSPARHVQAQIDDPQAFPPLRPPIA